MNRARGERHGRAKLTAARVRAIRAAYKRGATTRELAEDYGVCQTSICQVLLRKTWRHIQ